MEKIVQDALAKEAELASVITNIKESVRIAMKDAVMPGVRRIGRNPGCFIVSLSTIAKQPGLNLSAEYYSSDAQADLVDRRLRSAGTVSDIIARICDMAETGSVRLDGTQYQLNPTTREVLKNYIEKE